MYPTSAAYKAMVYSRDYARHFLPEVTLKMIDAAARDMSHYSANTASRFNNYPQIYDDITVGTFNFGCLEDFQFLLDGSKRLMANSNLTTEQIGYMSESMSGADGKFATPVVITCSYEAKISTVGRTLMFDTNYDSVPKDFDLEYYATGTLLHTVNVRDNTLYMYTSTDSISSYDTLIIRIYSMTRPYRRVHMPEDIPGIYFTYDDKQIVSMNANMQVDIFMQDIISGEVDFQLENAEKTLDILNPEGFEQYLQRRQPVSINLVMVFPDNSRETIPVGYMWLTDWKSLKGALTAQFTARDSTDALTLDEYVKGVIPATPVSLKELAVDVLEDAGIKDYTIDVEFLNIYSTAPLPIASHKELLRLIAQAGQGVVLTTVTGGIHLKYVSPLISATNQLANPDFQSGFTGWTQTGCSLSTTQVFSGTQSVSVATRGTLQQTVTGTIGHKWYVRFYAMPSVRLTSGSATFTINNASIMADLVQSNLQLEAWTLLSGIYTVTQASNIFKLANNTSALWVDGFMLIDLTTTYGAGNEPTKDWCDQNIRYFTTVLMIPRVRDPSPVDTLDYSVLIDSPEIATSVPCKSVEANIYSYVAEAETSEVYNGQRYVVGTEEFTIKFNKLAKDCKLEVKSLDDNGEPSSTNTATLVSSSIYAQAAVLKVTANSNVQIVVTGKAVNTQSSTYKIDSVMDANLVPDAKAQTIDNKLITNRTVAEDVAGYAAYWYNRRYTYSFDWRQNPAIQVFDTVTVYDDFNKNNPVLLTEQNLDYADGVLGGSSKGAY